MEKLTIEEFKQICERIAVVKNEYDAFIEFSQTHTEEESEEKAESFQVFVDEMDVLSEKLRSSDLSDIPAEAWSGYIDLVGTIDLEGTGANIDLSMIQTPYLELTGKINLRLRGCNVINFDYDTSRYNFDDASFDGAFFEEAKNAHPEMFLSAGITDEEVIGRIVEGQIKLKDIKKYPVLASKVKPKDLSSETRGLVERIGIDAAMQIDDVITDTEEIFASFTKMASIHKTADLDVIKPYMFEDLKSFIRGTNSYMKYEERYERLSQIPFVREGLPEVIWDFPEGKEELKSKYLNCKLTIRDVISNIELFEGKEFLQLLEYDDRKKLVKNNDYYYRYDEEEFEITEKELMDFFKNVPDVDAVLDNYPISFIKSMIQQLDFSKDPEELQKDIRDNLFEELKRRKEKGSISIDGFKKLFPVKELIELASDGDHSSYYIDRMFEHADLERIVQEYDVPLDLFSNYGFVNFLHTFGPRAIFEFDRENNQFFSKNNYENAKNINSYFLHYDGNNWDGSTKICLKGYNLETFEYEGYDERIDYTRDEMYESVRRMILHGPSDFNLASNNLSHADMGEEFKARYPELYLSDNVPPYIQRHFFDAHITFGDLKVLKETNPEALEEIYSKPQSLTFRKTFKGMYLQDIDVDMIFRLAEQYGNYIKGFDFSKTDKPFDEVAQEVERYIEEQILSGNVKYGPDVPDFMKQKYPELFLDENAPEELKLLYYPGYVIEDVEGFRERFTGNAEELESVLELSKAKEENRRGNYALSITALKNKPEYISYLQNKNLALGGNPKLKQVVSVFSSEEFYEIATTDIEALEIVANAGPEKIERFARLLDEMPEKYAIRDLKSKHGYTDEEIEMIISGDEEVTDEKILEARKNFSADKASYREWILTTPGYVVHCPDEFLEQFNFDEFDRLEDMSNFEVSEHYRRDIAEQVIVSMYSFLGYENSRKVMELPNVSTEELEEAVKRTGIAVSEIYEKNYNVKDNLRVLNTLFDKLTPSLPGGKKNFELYSAINAILESGFEGSLEELLESAFEKSNIEYNPERLNQIVRNTKDVNSLNKLETIAPAIENYINDNMVATPDNKKILAEILTNAVRRSFRESEKIDFETIGEFIDKEFAKVKPNGAPYYSPHITSKKEELLEVANFINSHPEYGEIANKTTVDILQEEKEKIGKGWIRKLLSIETQKISEAELMSLKTKLYGDRDVEIPAEKHFVLKDKSAKGVEEAYILLKEMELPGVFTIEKGEVMFAGLTPPYSEGFQKIFMENMEEVMRLPEYFTAFQLMHRRFDEIVSDVNVANRYAAGKYTIKQLLEDAKDVMYDNVHEGEYELAYRAKRSGLSQEEFDAAKIIYAQMREREKQVIPPVEHNGKRYVGRILRSDEALHLTIGNVTTCCQRFGSGQPGETSMIHSATEENGSVFVVEEVDEFDNVVNVLAQSWTWRNNDRVCFDNVEIPDTLAAELLERKVHHEIFEVYRQVAQKMIDVDKKSLQKLLDAGKITKEQYEALVIKQVTIGTGCDNLISHLPAEDMAKMRKVDTVRPKEINKRYSGVNKNSSLYVDSHTQLVIAENEEMLDKKTKSGIQLEEIGFGYTKVRGITRRDGEDIHKDLVTRMKKMNVRAGEEVASQSMVATSMGMTGKGIVNEDYYLMGAKPFLAFSEDDDWYIFYTEKDNDITIQDSLLLPQEDASVQDKRMAKLEYIREILLIAKKAKTMQKTFKLSANREGKFIDLAKFAQEDIIEVDENGVVTIKDDARCDAMINSLDNNLSQEKTDRILNTIKPSDPETPSTPTEENDLDER